MAKTTTTTKKRAPMVEAFMNKASYDMYEGLKSFFQNKKLFITYAIGYGSTKTKTVHMENKVEAKFTRVYVSDVNRYIKIHAEFDLPIDPDATANKFVISYGYRVIESFKLKKDEIVDHYDGRRFVVERIIDCNLKQKNPN